MNRKAIAKKTAGARSALIANANWLAEQAGVDAAFAEAVAKARGKGQTLVANQLLAVSTLLGAVCTAMGRPEPEPEPSKADKGDEAAAGAPQEPAGASEGKETPPEDETPDSGQPEAPSAPSGDEAKGAGGEFSAPEPKPSKAEKRRK